MAQAYFEHSDSSNPDHPPVSPNLLSKAIMTRSLPKAYIDYNGPIPGWSSTPTGCFDQAPKSFVNSKFIVPKPGNYHISYSIPYQLSEDAAASYDGVHHPGFMLFTGDQQLMNFQPLLAINTPTLKCFVQNHTLTFSVTWQLPQGAQLSIFYLGSSKNQDIETQPVVPITIAPEPDQLAWWSIIRLA